ncbi:hypothetical protein JY96_18635 [Aquabacterium sp. NJ1]|uniref:energy transducer TonB n=1 Tax=Aquabacterium sp. NJ1 TaxID=1538295 RepID=UPI00052C149F|nr:energy transducer TonB [Aquabacterium sp. NJ1]KGM41401.1 hypothetical protein JY96_18635 [Aquabacterium sp. NJ1]
MPASIAIHDGQPYTFRISPLALAMVVAAHAGVALLLTISRTLPSTPPQAPLMVEVITAKAPVPPAPKAPDITPPKPKPVARQERFTRAQDVPVLAAKPVAQEPVANETKAVPPAPLPPIQTPPAPAQAAPSSHAVPAAAPTSPQFDADYLDNPKPVYPPISRREREQGKVLLRVYVEVSGAAGKVELVTSSGYDRLDKAARAAVGRWRFVPARQGSEAVAAWVTVPIIFSLKD